MCGIIGSARHGSCLPVTTSLNMRDSLAHRGPDDAGLWRSTADGVTLGSRRLAILDLSPRGRQPMHDPTNTYTIVFNGEIYNFKELRKELCQTLSFRSSSDTEVLLAAYSAWGIDCLQMLNGMFAFAIWDSKERVLFAARDRFGEKPFYYFRRPSLFLFASEMKALLASEMVSPEPNISAIYRFLAFRETDANQETFLKDVFSLPPAHALLYSPARDSLKTWRYWDVDPQKEIRYSNDQSYSESLLDLLQQSVSIRSRSDVPVGSCLSGGIDSSSIVSLVASQSSTNKQATFSARFHDQRIDEGSYIQSVCSHFSVPNHTVYPDPLRMVEEMDNFVWHQEHPFVGPSIYAQWCVMRLAKDHRVTVLLDGQGSDESLAGYLVSQGSHYRDLFADLKWISLTKGLAAEWGRGGLRSVSTMLLPQVPILRNQLASFIANQACVLPEFSAIACCPPTKAPEKFKSALHNELFNQISCSMLPKLLRFADRSSMAFSREVRLPFLDHRVVEYLFAIPEQQKIRNATTKFVLRNAFRGRLPAKVLDRTDKKGFETPESAWLRGPLRAWAEAILHSRAFRERGWINQDAVLWTWQEFLSGAKASQSVLFRWLSLEVWARRFLRQPSVAFSAVPETEIRLGSSRCANTCTITQET